MGETKVTCRNDRKPLPDIPKPLETYCKGHSRKNYSMEVNCSYRLEPQGWQIPASID